MQFFLHLFFELNQLFAQSLAANIRGICQCFEGLALQVLAFEPFGAFVFWGQGFVDGFGGEIPIELIQVVVVLRVGD